MMAGAAANKVNLHFYFNSEIVPTFRPNFRSLTLIWAGTEIFPGITTSVWACVSVEKLMIASGSVSIILPDYGEKFFAPPQMFLGGDKWRNYSGGEYI